jgi:hypothetical protein
MECFPCVVAANPSNAKQQLNPFHSDGKPSEDGMVCSNK